MRDDTRERKPTSGGTLRAMFLTPGVVLGALGTH